MKRYVIVPFLKYTPLTTRVGALKSCSSTSVTDSRTTGECGREPAATPDGAKTVRAHVRKLGVPKQGRLVS
jgi:hypothetical protein